MKYQRYAEYKDSGVEWLGEVPAHWELTRIKSLVGNRADVVQTGPFGAQLHADDYIDEGVPLVLIKNVNNLRIDDTDIPRISLDDAERLSMYRLQRGDIVFSRVGSIGRIAMCTERENGWLISGQMLRMRLYSLKLSSEFALYAFSSPQVLVYVDLTSVGSTRESINTDILRNFPLPIPSFDEQTAIAAFLDRETAQIDALIAKQERLIAALQEKRQALISHAVTKGLNPDAPMKDSGVEWLGEVPAHWGAVRLKQKWFVIDCKHRTATYIDNGIPIVSTTEVKPGRIVLDGARQTTEQDYQDLAEGRRKPQRSDIIYSRNASVGSAAYVDTDERFCMGQDVCLITSDCENQLFLMYQLNSPIVMNQVDAFGVGATFSRINVQQIENFFVACPPLSEQIEIAEYIDRHDQMFVALMRHVTMIRILLLERRAALISAAVTGKIDVRSQVR